MADSRMFFDGMFHAGKCTLLPVIEADYPCEYTLNRYLAALTAGEAVAVGWLHVPEAITVEELHAEFPDMPDIEGSNGTWWYEVPIVVIPGVGVWICGTIFGAAAEAYADALKSVAVIERALGRSTKELPIEIALFQVLPDEPDLRGIDPRFYFDADSFASVAQSLSNRRSRDWAPETVDATVRQLLEVGSWVDDKAPDPPVELEIPRWLIERMRTASHPSN